MRYAAVGVFALAAALSLSSGKARGAGVEVDADINVNVGVSHDAGFFEAQLAPHGKWLDLPTYGRVWQPAVVLTDRDWRPYLNNGHWAWTDAGWYWESSYPWGWAAFHYGRWNYVDNHLWVWSPDSVWAPAWVSWRYSQSHYGWAPLPHGSRFEGGVFIGASVNLGESFFNFVPSQSFLSVNLFTVAVPRAQVVNIYKETTIVNNSYVYNDNRVINNGIPVAQVAAATKQEVKPKIIADAKAPSEKGEAGKIAAYRPEIKAAPAAKAADTKSGEKNTKAKDPQPTDPTIKAPETKPETATKVVAPKAVETAEKPNEPNRADPKVKPNDERNPEPKAKREEGMGEEGKREDESKRDDTKREDAKPDAGKRNDGKSEKAKSEDAKR